MIKIKTIPVILEQNSRVIFEGEESIVVDPGSDARRIKAFCDSEGLKIREIWLTHSHIDHAGGVSELLSLCDEKPRLLGDPGEKMFRENIELQAQMFGIPPGMVLNCPEPGESFSEGQALAFGGKVLFTPGHSPGHFSFLFSSAEVDGVPCEHQVLIAGDTLFRSSIGRTDLPGGNYETLISSIREKMFTLPDDTLVLPGHGDSTTVGYEKQTNPFLKL